LFVKGVIRPFQDFGSIRQYAPLAYLIPGQIEAWFGNSLLTGRYFSVFCSMLMIVALWITVRRMRGEWWAACVIWGIALTPISIQIYSLALSEALVACILAWSLMLVLGENRPLWQIIVGAILAGIMGMTRQNLILVLPVLVGYIFWQHGKKAGLWALVSCLLPILIIHIIFWPNILQLWAIWIPSRLTPFLDAFRFPNSNNTLTNGIDFQGRLLSFLSGFRFHYFTMIGFCITLFLWPKPSEWKSQVNRRAAGFLAALFLVLVLLHAWATVIITNPSVSCTFCFTPYLSFFDIIVFFLIPVSISTWRKSVSKIVEYVIITFVLIISTGLGYASFDRFGPWLLNFKFPAFTRGLNPSKWSPFITIWDILANKFHQDYWTSRVKLSVAAGLILGILFLILGWMGYKYGLKYKKINGYSFGALTLNILLGLGVLLSPLMGGTYRDDGICKANIPGSYAQIGTTLNNIIPTNSLVYWSANTAVPLLYASNINIYIPQIYATSYFGQGGDSNLLLKQGFWNQELAKQWLAKADYIVSESDWYQRADLKNNINITQYNTIQTVPANPCNPSSYLVIFIRQH